jgi:cytochrome c peroxidase
MGVAALLAAGAAAASALLALAGPARAHEGEQHAAPAARPGVLAPGYGELAFTPPAPGSYALPPLGDAADGRVLASDGTPTTLHAVYGDRVVLLSFVYASCNDVNGCPLATAVLHRVQRRLGEEPELAGRLRLASLSFDPARDTPEMMQRYGRPFANGEVEWRFLTTASTRDLDPILEAYGQAVRRELDAQGNPLDSLSHVLRVFLIDREHRIRNIYSVSFLHADTLLNDVKTVLMDADGTSSRAVARAASAPGLRGPGDDRHGYESRDYRSRSGDLGARRGAPADLLGRAAQPPLGLPPVPVPDDNTLTAEKIALGRKLFYDRRLSANDTFSCAMCHIPEQGFTNNELATAVGIEGRTVRRNAPTLYNVAYSQRLFHDGRETRLEHQVWGPLLARNEMGNPSIGAVIEKIRHLPDYEGLFDAAFPARGLALETVGMALASYERTLVSGGSPFVRWRYTGEDDALPEAAQRGFELFAGRARCGACHPVGDSSALFTDGAFHNTGIGYAASMLDTSPSRRIQVAPGRYLEVDRAIVARVSEPPPSDLGLYELTGDPDDRWKYKTPSLRNVALTAPYMHDGSLSTLRDVVAFYDRGGVPNEVQDPRVRPLGLTAAEIDDLVAFLASLTGGDVDLLVADAFAAPIGDPTRE